MAGLATANTLVDVDRLGTATALGVLWRERIGERRGQQRYVWFLLSCFFLPQSLRTFSSVAEFVFSSGVYFCWSLLRSGPGSWGSPRCWCIRWGSENLPQLGLAPELLFKSPGVSWVRCRAAPGTPLFRFLNTRFYSVRILCQWRNYTAYFKILLVVKLMFHLCRKQVPLS